MEFLLYFCFVFLGKKVILTAILCKTIHHLNFLGIAYFIATDSTISSSAGITNIFFSKYRENSACARLSLCMYYLRRYVSCIYECVHVCSYVLCIMYVWFHIIWNPLTKLNHATWKLRRSLPFGSSMDPNLSVALLQSTIGL